MPIEVEKDTHRTGEGPTRNRAISRVKTEWVTFLDDDDELTPDFLEKFRETLEEDPDVIIFRAKFPDGAILPKTPQITYGNVTIACAVKTELAQKNPFTKGARKFLENEDYLFLKALEAKGSKVVFSPHVTYVVKPSKEAQANAVKNN